LVTQIEIAMSN